MREMTYESSPALADITGIDDPGMPLDVELPLDVTRGVIAARSERKVALDGR